MKIAKISILAFVLFLTACSSAVNLPNNDYAQKITDATLVHQTPPAISQNTQPPTVLNDAKNSQSTIASNHPSFQNIPVLMFHYVRTVDKTKDLLGYNLSIEPESFAKLLDALDQKGYHTIHVADLLSVPTKSLPSKPIILTFDDGYEDFFLTVLPLLKKHQFNASAAIITAKMQADTSAQTYMDESQIQQIDQEGIEILSHSVTHPDLSKDLSQQKELENSKSTLEKLLNHPIKFFVYPSGKYNDNTLKLAAEAGYQMAFTTQPGLANSSQNSLEQPRIRVDNRSSIESILKKL